MHRWLHNRTKKVNCFHRWVNFSNRTSYLISKTQISVKLNNKVYSNLRKLEWIARNVDLEQILKMFSNIPSRNIKTDDFGFEVKDTKLTKDRYNCESSAYRWKWQNSRQLSSGTKTMLLKMDVKLIFKWFLSLKMSKDEKDFSCTFSSQLIPDIFKNTISI